MNKKILLIIICLLLLFSCFQKDKQRSFEVIDFSYYNGWDNFYSIRVDSDGEVCVLKEDGGKTLVQKYLPNEVFDSISSLLNKIDFCKLDSLYKENCVDCGYYSLLVKNHNKRSKLFVENIDNSNPSLKEINHLKTYLVYVSKELLRNTDSIKFESKMQEFYPVPPPLMD